MYQYANFPLDWTKSYTETESLRNDVISTINGTKFDQNEINNLETPIGRLKFICKYYCLKRFIYFIYQLLSK